MSDWTPEQVATVVSATAALIGAVAAIVSAVFAGVAIWTQRRAARPRLRVSHETGMPVFGMAGRSFAGSHLGDALFAIRVHNSGQVPVTILNVSLEFEDGGNAPYLGAPFAGGETLPKALAAGDEATFYLDPLPNVAAVHAEHGGAKWATATIGGGRKFHGGRISRRWLDGWVDRGGPQA